MHLRLSGISHISAVRLLYQHGMRWSPSWEVPSLAEGQRACAVLRAAGDQAVLLLPWEVYYGHVFELLVARAGEPPEARAACLAEGPEYRARGRYRGALRLYGPPGPPPAEVEIFPALYPAVPTFRARPGSAAYHWHVQASPRGRAAARRAAEGTRYGVRSLFLKPEEALEVQEVARELTAALRYLEPDPG